MVWLAGGVQLPLVAVTVGVEALAHRGKAHARSLSSDCLVAGREDEAVAIERRDGVADAQIHESIRGQGEGDPQRILNGL